MLLIKIDHDTDEDSYISEAGEPYRLQKIDNTWKDWTGTDCLLCERSLNGEEGWVNSIDTDLFCTNCVQIVELTTLVAHYQADTTK